MTEFPKSGGTWLSELVSDTIGIPFPQNRFPSIGKTLYHGHHVRKFAGVSTIVLWRDPRDIVVSWYFHNLVSTHTHERSVEASRNKLGFADVADIRTNLPRFIRYMFEEQQAPGFTWSEFFDTWSVRTSGCLHTSYELLTANAAAEIHRLTDELNEEPVLDIEDVVHRHSFEVKAGRRRGAQQSASFLRNGVVGNWKEAFSQEAVSLLRGYLGERIDTYENTVKRLTASA